jgi:predicted membrane protein
MPYLFWIFLAYSFFGWLGETVIVSIEKKKFVNRGILNSPLSISYGIVAVILTFIYFRQEEIHIIFFAGLIIGTLVQWIAGHVIEKIYHRKWWDYTGLPWNLDGYICLYASLGWGVLGLLSKFFINPILSKTFDLFPNYIRTILFITLGIFFIIDLLATHFAFKGVLSKYPNIEKTGSNLSKITYKIGHLINKRLSNAYKLIEVEVKPKEKTDKFAYGINFYKVFLLFVIGSFLGDITETIFCKVTAGIWMSRTSLVIGAFSLVWGIAIGLATVLLYKYKDREDGFIFLVGTFLGGAYEYFCSVFTELVFGKVFWNYSEIPFNLGGRINLLFCFFWGIAAVVWIKNLYPIFSDLIEKLPVSFGKMLTWFLVVFMIFDITLSSAAMARSGQREKNIPATNALETWLDIHYDDAKMQKIYPNSESVQK